jgi:superfamily II DNA/RNA helicase
MILENLCLDSLISYFDRLIQIYNELYQRKSEKEENTSFNKSSFSLISLDNDDDDDETDVLNLSPDSIYELIDIYLNVHKKLKGIRKKTNYISDRLKKLYEKISDLFKQYDESKFIIFIANRIVAHFLKPALSSYLKENFENKKCDEIIGINKRKSEGGTTLTPSLTLKKLNEIISNFNEDKFDILIGTSAIEEGLDIQSCNAVLALVEINTPKSFIQVKGRARKSNSHFYIFTNSAKSAKLKVRDFINMGKKMKELFNGNIVNDFRSKGYISKKPDFIYDMDTTTHSKITWGNVSIFFNEIKQQIESKGITFQTNIELQKVKSLKGNPEFVYKGIINLSTNLKNLGDKFPYQTKLQNDKDSATKICQFYLLKVLKKSKYLDSHLKFIKK